MESFCEADDLFQLAEWANQMDRQEDVLDFLEKLIEKNPHLDEKSRNLFASASKYVIGRARQSLRILAWYQRNELADGVKDVTTEYYDDIGKQLIQLCRKTLKMLEDSLIPHATEVQTKVFYSKLRGDYYRYITEYELDENRSQAIEDAGKAYEEGLKLAVEGLDSKDYHLLGLALSYSVYHYEVCNCTDKACELAQKTLDEGEEALKKNPEDYEECEGVLQLLRDNLAIWKNEKDC